MEGPILPEGSGGEEPPAVVQFPMWNERVRIQQERRMAVFELALEGYTPAMRQRRGSFNDYRIKNCEEASGSR